MVEILCRRTIGGLTPEGESEAVQVLQKIAVGELVVCEIRDPRRRSVQYHRYFFALLNKVWANQQYFKSVDHLRKALLIRLGYYDKIVLKNGLEVYIEQSMSFSKMDKTTFDKFATECINLICEEIIPNMDANGLRRELENMTGIQ